MLPNGPARLSQIPSPVIQPVPMIVPKDSAKRW
jgi:hypothetical protein